MYIYFLFHYLFPETFARHKYLQFLQAQHITNIDGREKIVTSLGY